MTRQSSFFVKTLVKIDGYAGQPAYDGRGY